MKRRERPGPVLADRKGEVVPREPNVCQPESGCRLGRSGGPVPVKSPKIGLNLGLGLGTPHLRPADLEAEPRLTRRDQEATVPLRGAPGHVRARCNIVRIIRCIDQDEAVEAKIESATDIDGKG